jgi:hypothetical protein
MLTQEQKQWFYKHEGTDVARNLILSEKGRDNIFPPIMLNFRGELYFTENQSYRLLAFPEEALVYGYEQYQARPNVKDTFKWMIGILNNWCKDRGIKPDWAFYSTICATLNIDRFSEEDPNTPVVYDALEFDNKTITKKLLHQQSYIVPDHHPIELDKQPVHHKIERLGEWIKRNFMLIVEIEAKKSERKGFLEELDAMTKKKFTREIEEWMEEIRQLEENVVQSEG